MEYTHLRPEQLAERIDNRIRELQMAHFLNVMGATEVMASADFLDKKDYEESIQTYNRDKAEAEAKVEALKELRDQHVPEVPVS